jgi:hypothetical protein
MENIDIKPQLKELQKTIETLTAFSETEKQKFKVGLILKESIDNLRKCLSSLEQMHIRGEKVNSARQDNLKILRIILLNFLDLSLILGVGERSGATLLKTQLLDKISPVKKSKKKGLKV